MTASGSKRAAAPLEGTRKVARGMEDTVEQCDSFLCVEAFGEKVLAAKVCLSQYVIMVTQEHTISVFDRLSGNTVSMVSPHALDASSIDLMDMLHLRDADEREYGFVVIYALSDGVIHVWTPDRSDSLYSSLLVNLESSERISTFHLLAPTTVVDWPLMLGSSLGHVYRIMFKIISGEDISVVLHSADMTIRCRELITMTKPVMHSVIEGFSRFLSGRKYSLSTDADRVVSIAGDTSRSMPMLVATPDHIFILNARGTYTIVPWDTIFSGLLQCIHMSMTRTGEYIVGVFQTRGVYDDTEREFHCLCLQATIDDETMEEGIRILEEVSFTDTGVSRVEILEEIDDVACCITGASKLWMVRFRDAEVTSFNYPDFFMGISSGRSHLLLLESASANKVKCSTVVEQVLKTFHVWNEALYDNTQLIHAERYLLQLVEETNVSLMDGILYASCLLLEEQPVLDFGRRKQLHHDFIEFVRVFGVNHLAHADDNEEEESEMLEHLLGDLESHTEMFSVIMEVESFIRNHPASELKLIELLHCSFSPDGFLQFPSIRFAKNILRSLSMEEGRPSAVTTLLNDLVLHILRCLYELADTSQNLTISLLDSTELAKVAQARVSESLVCLEAAKAPLERIQLTSHIHDLLVFLGDRLDITEYVCEFIQVCRSDVAEEVQSISNVCHRFEMWYELVLLAQEAHNTHNTSLLDTIMELSLEGVHAHLLKALLHFVQERKHFAVVQDARLQSSVRELLQDDTFLSTMSAAMQWWLHACHSDDVKATAACVLPLSKKPKKELWEHSFYAAVGHLLQHLGGDETDDDVSLESQLRLQRIVASVHGWHMNKKPSVDALVEHVIHHVSPKTSFDIARLRLDDALFLVQCYDALEHVEAIWRSAYAFESSFIEQCYESTLSMEDTLLCTVMSLSFAYLGKSNCTGTLREIATSSQHETILLWALESAWSMARSE